MNDEIREIKIYKANKCITFINNGIGFSQFGIADEILDLITDLQKENERLNNIIKIMEKYFELIVDLGYDYDGLNEIEDLKTLIDGLVGYASLGRAYNTTEPIFINNDKKYNILNEELKEGK